MSRSEALASVCAPLWELRSGRRKELPEWFDSIAEAEPPSPLVDRIVHRLDEFAEAWGQLPVGGTITLPWPKLARR